VVAVLGAAHVPGITKEIHNDQDLQALTKTKPKSKTPQIIGWAIPVLIVALIAFTFFLNPSAGMDQAISWILWTGITAALGASAALGHPLAILAAFIAAPITTLHPLLAAGWVSGLVQAYIKRPSVADFENLSEDVFSLKGFWRNKFTRVLLVIILTNIGGSFGTFIGGADVIRTFFNNL
jgi:pheromone shutdown-related protein TraB